MSIDTYYGDSDIVKVKIGDKMACEEAIMRLLHDDELCKTLGSKGYSRIIELSPESIYSKIKEQF